MSRNASDTAQDRHLWLHWALVLLLTAICCAPLAYPGYFLVHEGFLPIFNLYDLETATSVLTWRPSIGHEVDVLSGEGTLPYLVAELVRWLGAGGVVAVKATFALALVLGAAGVFAWTRLMLDRRGAVLASLIYACWPFALATIYVRGALAEALFLGLCPWALWAVQRLLRGGRWWTIALASIVALLLWTKPGLACWAAAVLLAYGLAGSISRWVEIVAATLGGLLVGVGGLWPQISAHGLTSTTTDFADHFIYPFQLLSASWGHGISRAGWQDNFPLQLGLAAVGLAVLGMLALFGSRAPSGKTDTTGRYQPEVRRALPFAWISMGMALTFVFMSTTLSAPLWRWPGLAQASKLLTYPWQLMVFLGPFLAFLGGLAATAGLARTVERERFPLWAGLIILVMLASYGYLQPLTTSYAPGPAPLALLGDSDIMLLDGNIQGSLAPGQRVQLTVHWQPLRPVAKDYTVFVHAVDRDGTRWGQEDTQPRQGEHPTSVWQVGEIIEDTYELRISGDGPTGAYTLQVGMYDWQTGLRLPVGSDDKVVLEATQ